MSTSVETLQTALEHHRAGRLVEAELIYRRLLREQPRNASLVHLLGLIAFQVGNLDLAAQLINGAIQLDKFRATYPADLAEVFRATGKIDEAIVLYRHSLTLDDELPESHNNLGTLLLTQGEADAAIESFQRAIELKDGYADAWCNLARAYQAQQKFDDALETYRKSMKLGPDQPDTYLHLGTCLHETGGPLDAIACYQKAMQLRTEWPEPLYQRGLARLTQGDMAGGWRDFEARLRCKELAGREMTLPLWNGSELGGKSILIHAQNSASDTIQFVRYLPLVAQRGGKVVFEVDGQWIPLLENSGFSGLLPADAPPPPCDVHAPLLSLPKIFATTLETVPKSVPYLKAPADRVAAWRDKLKAIQGFKVGIDWYGGRLRSIPLIEYAALAGVPGVTLVALPLAEAAEQLHALEGKFSVAALEGPFDESDGGLTDTAAIMANLDLIVAADTPSAHLAGALGRPVWVALSTAADWRWMQYRSDSPWYPTMRLFRQAQWGNWADCFAGMAEELPSLVAAARR